MSSFRNPSSMQAALMWTLEAPSVYRALQETPCIAILPSLVHAKPAAALQWSHGCMPSHQLAALSNWNTTNAAARVSPHYLKSRVPLPLHPCAFAAGQQSPLGNSKTLSHGIGWLLSGLLRKGIQSVTELLKDPSNEMLPSASAWVLLLALHLLCQLRDPRSR